MSDDDEVVCDCATIAQDMTMVQVINVVLVSLIGLTFGLLIIPYMALWLGGALALALAILWCRSVQLLLCLARASRAAAAYPRTWPGEAVLDLRRG
jgi:hypothetical protein